MEGGGREKEREREFSDVSSSLDTNPYGLATNPYDFIDLIVFLRALSPNTVPFGVGASTFEFWGTQFNP